MQNLIQKFRQSTIVSKKPGILPEKLKALMSSETLHTFPTYQYLQKGA